MRKIHEMQELREVCLYPPYEMQLLRVKGMIVGIPKCDGACQFADFKIEHVGHKFIHYIHEADYQEEVHWTRKDEQMG